MMKLNSEEKLWLNTKMFDLLSNSGINDGILPEDPKASRLFSVVLDMDIGIRICTGSNKYHTLIVNRTKLA
jgi:hypothetical protein